MIYSNTFYKAKSTVDGQATPGGYYYVVSAGDPVKFAVADEPKKELLTGGTFSVSAADFYRLIETDA